MTTVDENESDLLRAAVTGTFKHFSVGDDELDAPAQEQIGVLTGRFAQRS